MLSRAATAPPGCPIPTASGERSKCCSGSEGTTLSGMMAVGGEEGAEHEGSGTDSPLKRAKSDAALPPSPPPPATKSSPFVGLMLSMDYRRAVESINCLLTNDARRAWGLVFVFFVVLKLWELLDAKLWLLALFVAPCRSCTWKLPWQRPRLQTPPSPAAPHWPGCMRTCPPPFLSA